MKQTREGRQNLGGHGPAYLSRLDYQTLGKLAYHFKLPPWSFHLLKACAARGIARSACRTRIKPASLDQHAADPQPWAD